MFTRYAPVSLGVEHPKQNNNKRKLWASLGALALVALYFTSSSHDTVREAAYPPSRSEGWQSAPVAGGRVVDFKGPTKASMHTNLVNKLNAAVTRPIPTHDDSLAAQQLLCPHSEAQADPKQLSVFGAWWAAVPDRQLRKARLDIAEAVAKGVGFNLDEPTPSWVQSTAVESSSSDWEQNFGDGRRGVVYTGGNGDTLVRLLTSMSALRKVGCTLPIEIWSFESELAKMPKSMKQQLEQLGDVTFRVSQAAKTEDPKQYQIKGEAIAHSAFTEILYLDSDNVPMRDPTVLFDSAVYKEHGIVLWPDFARDSPANPIFRLLGFDCDPQEWTAETGQILVNREAQEGMNQAALLAAEAMQRDSDFWFKLSQGDKDTFRYAFKFLGIDYTPAPHLLSAAGSTTAPFPGEVGRGRTFCGHTMLQYGLSAAEWDQLDTDVAYEKPTDHAPPLFMHANLLKESSFLWLRDLLGPTAWAWIKTLTGKGWNYRKGNTFNSIKFASQDLVNAPAGSTLLTDHLRYGVYHCRGAGTDIWTDDSAESSEGVRLMDFKEAWGGILRNFESDLFYALKDRN